jgi:hypothetical protein
MMVMDCIVYKSMERLEVALNCCRKSFCVLVVMIQQRTSSCNSVPPAPLVLVLIDSTEGMECDPY